MILFQIKCENIVTYSEICVTLSGSQMSKFVWRNKDLKLEFIF
jgi:hypothetical protein